MSEENIEVRYLKVSPGRGAEYWDEFRDNNFISIGWYNDKDWTKTKFGDLTINPDNEKIKMVLREYYQEKDTTDMQIAQWAAIIRLFLEIKLGDKVVVYGKKFHINAMCEVIGEYKFEKDFYYPHTKKVKWIKIFGPQFDAHGNVLNEDAVPLDIRPIKDTLETKIQVPKTVIKMNKKDWDTIYDYAEEITGDKKILKDIVHVKKDLIDKAFDELGKNKAPVNELISKLKEIVGRNDGVLVDDETARLEIQKLIDKKNE